MELTNLENQVLLPAIENFNKAGCLFIEYLRTSEDLDSCWDLFIKYSHTFLPIASDVWSFLSDIKGHVSDQLVEKLKSILFNEQNTYVDFSCIFEDVIDMLYDYDISEEDTKNLKHFLLSFGYSGIENSYTG
jgi:hypothetical protein